MYIFRKLTHWPLEDVVQLYKYIFQTYLLNWYFEYFLWKWFLVNARKF